MALTSIEHYIVNVDRTEIPNKGLGNYVGGFTEENKPFNWANIFLNLIPGAGQLLFVGHVVRHWWVKSHANRILLYENGFIKQTLNGKRSVKKESTHNFNEMNGLLFKKARQYQNIYGFQKYNGTNVELSVLENNTKKKILTGTYRNEKDIDGHYNFIGYACNAINNAWLQFALQKFNREYSTQGYGTFSTPNGEVKVGRDFIEANNTIVSSGFKYAFNNGYLFLYPNAAEGAHFKQKSDPIAINVAEMYNKDAFLLAISQIHGIQ